MNIITGSYRKLFKILYKLKKALSEESTETAYMLDVYFRKLKGDATPNEVKVANAQFRDLLKTVGVGFLVVMPLAPVTLVVLVWIGKKFKVDILPSWFSKK